MMETTISVILIFMIAGALFALHAKDLLSALVSFGFVGYSLVICFLLLKAPDLAIVQVVIESITLIFMVAVVMNSTGKEVNLKAGDTPRLGAGYTTNLLLVIILMVFLLYFFTQAIQGMDPLGIHTLRMARTYVESGTNETGSVNLVSGILLNFRGYDTLGEATILVTAVIGILTVLRSKAKKN